MASVEVQPRPHVPETSASEVFEEHPGDDIPIERPENEVPLQNKESLEFAAAAEETPNTAYAEGKSVPTPAPEPAAIVESLAQESPDMVGPLPEFADKPGDVVCVSKRRGCSRKLITGTALGMVACALGIMVWLAANFFIKDGHNSDAIPPRQPVVDSSTNGYDKNMLLPKVPSDDASSPVELLLDDKSASPEEGVLLKAGIDGLGNTPFSVRRWYGNKTHKDFHHDGGSGPARGRSSMRYAINVDVTGCYEVYEWHPSSSDFDSLTRSASLTVLHSGGETSLSLDQSTAGGQWNHIGDFVFFETDDNSLVLSNAESKCTHSSLCYTNFDAFKLRLTTRTCPEHGAKAKSSDGAEGAIKETGYPNEETEATTTELAESTESAEGAVLVKTVAGNPITARTTTTIATATTTTTTVTTTASTTASTTVVEAIPTCTIAEVKHLIRLRVKAVLHGPAPPIDQDAFQEAFARASRVDPSCFFDSKVSVAERQLRGARRLMESKMMEIAVTLGVPVEKDEHEQAAALGALSIPTWSSILSAATVSEQDSVQLRAIELQADMVDPVTHLAGGCAPSIIINDFDSDHVVATVEDHATQNVAAQLEAFRPGRVQQKPYFHDWFGDIFLKDFHHDNAENKGLVKAVYTAELPKPGCYLVEEWHLGGNRYCCAYMPRSVPFQVHHAGGMTQVQVDQSTRGGQWNSVGVFSFDSSQARVVVSNNDTDNCEYHGACYTVFDAIRFVWAGNDCDSNQVGDADKPEMRRLSDSACDDVQSLAHLRRVPTIDDSTDPMIGDSDESPVKLLEVEAPHGNGTALAPLGMLHLAWHSEGVPADRYVSVSLFYQDYHLKTLGYIRNTGEAAGQLPPAGYLNQYTGRSIEINGDHLFRVRIDVQHEDVEFDDGWSDRLYAFSPYFTIHMNN